MSTEQETKLILTQTVKYTVFSEEQLLSVQYVCNDPVFFFFYNCTFGTDLHWVRKLYLNMKVRV